MQDYVGRLAALPSTAGLQEVETFLGTRPVQDMPAMRLHEVVLPTWDVLAARDRSARMPADAVELLRPVQLQLRSLRTPALLAGTRVQLRTPEGTWQRLIDVRGEMPVVSEDPAAEADLPVDAPAEELCWLRSGRHFLPGSRPRLTRQGGSYQELVALNVFGICAPAQPSEPQRPCSSPHARTDRPSQRVGQP